MKKRSPYNENAAIRGSIRRTFSRSPVVREVLAKVRREVPKYNKDGSRSKKNAVQYECNICKQYVSSTKVAVDHIDPVIHPEHGFKDWNEFVARLFCDASNLQPVCDNCHQSKSNLERFNRNLIKDREKLEQMKKAVAIGMADYRAIKRDLAKFTNKKLESYPQDLKEMALWLKAACKKAE